MWLNMHASTYIHTLVCGLAVMEHGMCFLLFKCLFRSGLLMETDKKYLNCLVAETTSKPLSFFHIYLRELGPLHIMIALMLQWINDWHFISSNYIWTPNLIWTPDLICPFYITYSRLLSFLPFPTWQIHLWAEPNIWRSVSVFISSSVYDHAICFFQHMLCLQSMRAIWGKNKVISYCMYSPQLKQSCLGDESYCSALRLGRNCNQSLYRWLMFKCFILLKDHYSRHSDINWKGAAVKDF